MKYRFSIGFPWDSPCFSMKSTIHGWVIAMAQVLANLGAAYGTAKSGVGIANLGVRGGWWIHGGCGFPNGFHGWFIDGFIDGFLRSFYVDMLILVGDCNVLLGYPTMV